MPLSPSCGADAIRAWEAAVSRAVDHATTLISNHPHLVHQGGVARLAMAMAGAAILRAAIRFPDWAVDASYEAREACPVFASVVDALVVDITEGPSEATG